jgi:hypothetical protein
MNVEVIVHHVRELELFVEWGKGAARLGVSHMTCVNEDGLKSTHDTRYMKLVERCGITRIGDPQKEGDGFP